MAATSVGRANGGLPVEALVEHAGERVEVGAAVDLLAADLLGGDVVERAERRAGLERPGRRLAEALR